MDYEEVKLFGSWLSPFVYRVIWALKLKGVKYEYVEEDLRNKSDLLLQYNPIYKKVPVLVHGGKPISESIVILEYIEETWPENPILPRDPYERSVARFWANFMDDKSPLVFWEFFTTTGEEQENVIQKCLKILRTLEDNSGIQSKKFFGGEAIGMPDIVFGWMAYWLGVTEDVVGIKLLKADTFPHLCAWMENFKQVQVIKDNIYDHDKLLAYLKQLREMYCASSTVN